MFGAIWNFSHYQVLTEVIHYQKIVHSVPVETNQFQGCAMHVLELHWHFQLVWQLWMKIGKFHTFPLPLRCHHWFSTNTLTPLLSECISQYPDVLHKYVPSLSIWVWKVWEVWNSVTSPSMTDSTSQKFQYRCNSCGSNLYSQGYPVLMWWSKLWL